MTNFCYVKHPTLSTPLNTPFAIHNIPSLPSSRQTSLSHHALEVDITFLSLRHNAYPPLSLSPWSHHTLKSKYHLYLSPSQHSPTSLSPFHLCDPYRYLRYNNTSKMKQIFFRDNVLPRRWKARVNNKSSKDRTWSAVTNALHGVIN